LKAYIINSGDFFPPSMDGPPKFLLVYAASRRAIILERESAEETDSIMREKALELEAQAMQVNRRDLDGRKRKAHNS
jgi:hypothetical protein